jgi:hypothetical protein
MNRRLSAGALMDAMQARLACCWYLETSQSSGEGLFLLFRSTVGPGRIAEAFRPACITHWHPNYALSSSTAARQQSAAAAFCSSATMLKVSADALQLKLLLPIDTLSMQAPQMFITA